MHFGFSPTQAEPAYDLMIHQARLAERLGFDTLWVHEHHSQSMAYPAPLMTLSVLAHHTQRIALGTNMVLLPLYHPLRVAEEAAMLDVLSNGRLILGLSAGYAPDEYQAFGVSLRQRGRRMEEGLALIRAVLTQSTVTLQGEHFRIENFSLFPRPLQQPAPPIYVGALADAAIRRAARFGDGYVLSAGSSIEQIGERIPFFRQAVRAVGADPERKTVALNRVVHIAKDRASKIQAQQFFAEHFLHLYDTWGHEDIQNFDERVRGYAETCRQHFIIGEASECIEQVHQYAELGVQHLACLMAFCNPEPAWVEQSMRRFAEDVMPHCRAL